MRERELRQRACRALGHEPDDAYPQCALTNEQLLEQALDQLEATRAQLTDPAAARCPAVHRQENIRWPT